MRPYADRREAGRILAPLVADALGDTANALVLALPRGGVPVAAEIADLLDAALDVIVVRKVGVPGQPEVAMGAVASVAGTVETVENQEMFSPSGQFGAEEFERRAAAARAELVRREHLFRGIRPALEISGRVAVVVDDGVATGASMRAAVQSLGQSQPERVIVAVPVCLAGAWPRLQDLAEAICPWLPVDFMAVGQAYRDFDQITDAEVQDILAGHRHDAG